MFNQSFNPFSANLAVVKDYFKTKSVLALAILRFAALVLSVVGSILAAPMVARLLPQLMSYMEDMMADIGASSLDLQLSTGPLSNVTSLIPAALMAVACLIIFLKSRDENPSASPIAGFTILFVLAIISLIGAILVCALLVLVLLIVCAAMFMMSSGSPEEIAGITAATIFLCVFYGVLIFFLLFSSVNYLKYIKSVRTSMTSLTLTEKGARPYGVVNVISGIIVLLYAILLPLILLLTDNANAALAEAFPGLTLDLRGFAPVVFTASVSMILSAVISFVSAKVAFGYSRHIRRVSSGYRSDFIPGPMGPSMSAEPMFFPQRPVNAPRDPASFSAAPDFNGFADSVCSSCGAEIDPDAVFCSRCGKKVK